MIFNCLFTVQISISLDLEAEENHLLKLTFEIHVKQKVYYFTITKRLLTMPSLLKMDTVYTPFTRMLASILAAPIIN